MKIYNTLTGNKQEFIPIEDGKVKMYACGITVSGEAHIGHAYQALIYDIMRKYLKKEGYDINLHCVLPCDNYQCGYYVYDKIKSYADTWTSLSKEFYRGCDNARDQYMVDHSDKIFAIWDGIEGGGVYSTIRKAQKKKLEIVYYPKEMLKETANV